MMVSDKIRLRMLIDANRKDLARFLRISRGEYISSQHCQVCFTKLKSKCSILKGVGPTCEKDLPQQIAWTREQIKRLEEKLARAKEDTRQ